MARNSDGTKREAILDAAVVEIARHGYYQTTVAVIARRAGVADGTIYLYFRNKEEILFTCLKGPWGVSSPKDVLRSTKGPPPPKNCARSWSFT